MRVMIDLETASDRPNAVITAIGVAVFDEMRVTQTSYIRVDGESHQKIGGHVSYSTFDWWLRQSEAARAEITTAPRYGITESLMRLSAFLSDVPFTEVWGNGADFDCVILQEAYAAAQLKCPFEFRQHACFRTLKRMFPKFTEDYLRGSYSDERVKHHALHDAVWQARRTIAMLGYLRNLEAAGRGV